MVKRVFGCGEEAHQGDDEIVAGRLILMFCRCGRQKKRRVTLHKF